jgi:branched-chain amino acid aminotransferase
MSGAAVWINESFATSIDASDRGLTLGDGVFDTLVAFRSVPFAGEAHLTRLQAQAGAIGIEVDPEQVRRGWEEVLGTAEAEHTILRTTVTGGPGGRGLWPRSGSGSTLIVTGTPWDASLFARSTRLVTSTISRDPGSPSSGLKSLGYLDGILAAREARERGGDDALLLTPAGQVACTTIANVLLSPGSADDAAAGRCGAAGDHAPAGSGCGGAAWAASRGTLSDARDLRSADQVFVTNSVRFLCPCAALDGDPLFGRGAETLGRLTDAICAQVLKTCGFDPRSGGEPSRRAHRDVRASSAPQRQESGIRASTAMLAVVTGPEEAAIALAGGADILHLGDQAPGASPLRHVEATIAAVAGKRPVWAAAKLSATESMASLKAMAGLGLDGLTLHLPIARRDQESVRALAQSASPARLIGVLFADREPDLATSIRQLAAGGCQGVILDVAERSGRLLACIDMTALGALSPRRVSAESALVLQGLLKLRMCHACWHFGPISSAFAKLFAPGMTQATASILLPCGPSDA